MPLQSLRASLGRGGSSRLDPFLLVIYSWYRFSSPRINHRHNGNPNDHLLRQSQEQSLVVLGDNSGVGNCRVLAKSEPHTCSFARGEGVAHSPQRQAVGRIKFKGARYADVWQCSSFEACFAQDQRIGNRDHHV